MSQCPAHRFCFREGLEPGKKLWDSLRIHSTCCGDDHWGRLWREQRMTGLPLLCFYIHHWLLKTVLGDWKLTENERILESGLGTSLSSVTSRVILSKLLDQSEPPFPPKYKQDKTTHRAGLLGTWNAITYVKNSVRCLGYSLLSVNIILSVSFSFHTYTLAFSNARGNIYCKTSLALKFGWSGNTKRKNPLGLQEATRHSQMCVKRWKDTTISGFPEALRYEMQVKSNLGSGLQL